MNLYFFILILVSVFVFFAQKHKNILFDINYTIALLILVLFAGLRERTVGTDTNNYAGIFEDVNYGKFSLMDTTLEYLFLFLNKVAFVFSENYISLLICIALIVVFFNFLIIKRLSSNPWLSVYVYITLGSYVSFFNGARQALAVAVFGMALLEIKNKNFKRYLFWVIVASLFHKTVLVMLPVYFILNTKFSYKKTIFIGVIFSLLIVFMSSLLSILSGNISNRYSTYNDRGATGAYLLTFFYIILTGFIIFWRKYISAGSAEKYNFYLNICVYHTLIYIVVQILGVDINLIRLAFYFQLGFVLIYPVLFKEIKIFKNPVTCILFLGIHILFYYISLGRMSNLVPYTFNPILNF